MVLAELENHLPLGSNVGPWPGGVVEYSKGGSLIANRMLFLARAPTRL
jgi:hypothetical protein